LQALPFAAPAPKTIENNSGEKGLLQAPLADHRMHASEPYRLPAKSSADLTGNSSKKRCLPILLKNPPSLHR